MKKINLLLFLISFSAQAEYRVYQYVVKNLVKTANDQAPSHIQISSLDPQAFIAYNGGSRLVALDLLRTWVCPGHTGHKQAYCPSPYAKLTKEMLP